MAWITLKEAELKYGVVKADTLRSYIHKNKIVPADRCKKSYHIWLIDEEWIQEYYLKTTEEEKAALNG